MGYFVYILRCFDDTLYTGITTDLQRRVGEHNGENSKGNLGSKYTAARRPVVLVYAQSFTNRSESSKEELRIKKLIRSDKELLIHTHPSLKKI